MPDEEQDIPYLEKERKYAQRYYQEHKEELCIKHREWRQGHQEQIREYGRKYKQEHKESVREQQKKYARTHPDKNRESNNEWRLTVKKETLTHYGGGRLSCVKCGFSDIRALTIDHINNKGADERRVNKWAKAGGATFYQRLRKQGYPKGYQTLCWNCQWIKKGESVDV